MAPTMMVAAKEICLFIVDISLPSFAQARKTASALMQLPFEGIPRQYWNYTRTAQAIKTRMAGHPQWGGQPFV